MHAPKVPLHPSLAFSEVTAEALGVFGPNKKSAFHRWVTFTEGFSAQLVIDQLADAPPSRVFDPFGGTGTTPLVAAQLGHEAAFAEINPYLALAAETKIKAATAPAEQRAEALAALRQGLAAGAAADKVPDDHPLLVADEVRAFFQPGVARHLLGWVRTFEDLGEPLARGLGRLAVGSVAVSASNMKRAVDLRRRTEAEINRVDPDVEGRLRRRLSDFADDIEHASVAEGFAVRVSDNARTLPHDFEPVDLIVTSPPYLNGTNYFRNTKLELLLLGLIGSEAELGPLRAQAITAGINNVSKRIAEPVRIEAVEPTAGRLDEVAYDTRIPKMVRAYFGDMMLVLEELARVASSDCTLVLDIGDSRFAGVHVDTPELLGEVAELVGWQRTHTETIRSRVAKDGGALCQKLLRLSLS